MCLYQCIQEYVSGNASEQQLSQNQNLLLKVSRLGQGGLLHWEQYVLKRKVLEDVASPLIPSLWKLLHSEANNFLSKLLKLQL